MTQKTKTALPPHQIFAVGLILSTLAGYLEAYTYLLRGGVFCNGQTANIALMALAFARGDMPKALSYPIPILSFFVGIVFAAQLRERISGIRRFRWEAAILLMEAALLFLVGLVPLTYAHAPVNVLVTFICAVQYEIFRETRGLPYASIFCTGNLRSAAEHFRAFIARREKTAGEACLRYILVILAFAVGVFGGAHLSNILGARSIWICSLMLVALVPMMIHR